MFTSARVAALLLALTAHNIRLGTQARRVSENSQAIAWDDIVNQIKEIDLTKDTDAFIVFESASDSELAVVAQPPVNKVSLETFKDALRTCKARSKICMGYYKVNYPMYVGSTTHKEKGVLVLAIPTGAKIAQKMPVTRFVWAPLKDKLRGHVSPNAVFELNGDPKIDAFDIETLWKEFAAKASRVETPEIEAFKVHGEQQIADAINGGPVVMTPTETDDKKNTGEVAKDGGHQTPSQGGNTGGVRVDPKMIEDLVAEKMKAVEEKVEKIVEDKASELAQKAAQDEVGRAIRKLGTEVQDAYTNVGKMWIDKAKA